MNLKTLLDQAKNSIAVLRHDLLLNNGSNAIHCFFEGQTDESFYGSHIRKSLGNARHFQAHICGNKDSVFSTFQELSGKIKPPTIGLFFTDKDIDNIIPVNRPKHASIYTTELYSIENHLADLDVIDRTISEVFRLGSGHAVCAALLATYQTQFEKSSKFFTEVMAWILFHRRTGSRPNLNNILLNSLCNISPQLEFHSLNIGEAIPQLDQWTEANTPANYLHDFHQALVDEINSYPKYSAIRGKFVLWFVVAFLNAVKNEICNHAPRRKISTEISIKTALDVLAPRVQTPATLSSFLRQHLG